MRIFPCDSQNYEVRSFVFISGIALIISGIFLALAAYQQLPQHVNAISGLGNKGLILAYGTLILGLVISYLSVKKKISKEESQKSPHQPLDKTRERFQQDIDRLKKHDTSLGVTSWKRSEIGRRERAQSFVEFTSSTAAQANFQFINLNIILLDNNFSKEVQKIIYVVAQYLAHVQGLKVSIARGELTGFNQSRKQYSIEENLRALAINRPHFTYILGLTSHDIYSDAAPTLNFVFGKGEHHTRMGLFSISRLQVSKKEKMLRRLMVLASHETAHMRGLPHCVDYSCNMQGGNSAGELDKTPLIFCSECAAKIAYINKWKVKEIYQRMLKFLQQHNFKKEIGLLKSRLTSCT